VTAPGKAIVRIDDAAIKERMRGLLADAWDEGKHSDHDPNCRVNGDVGECICVNPYRDEAQA
jgi:hypothetical protein